jgi:hypothetical protein
VHIHHPGGGSQRLWKSESSVSPLDATMEIDQRTFCNLGNEARHIISAPRADSKQPQCYGTSVSANVVTWALGAHYSWEGRQESAQEKIGTSGVKLKKSVWERPHANCFSSEA